MTMWRMGTKLTLAMLALVAACLAGGAAAIAGSSGTPPMHVLRAQGRALPRRQAQADNRMLHHARVHPMIARYTQSDLRHVGAFDRSRREGTADVIPASLQKQYAVQLRQAGANVSLSRTVAVGHLSSTQHDGRIHAEDATVDTASDTLYVAPASNTICIIDVQNATNSEGFGCQPDWSFNAWGDLTLTQGNSGNTMIYGIAPAGITTATLTTTTGTYTQPVADDGGYSVTGSGALSSFVLTGSGQSIAEPGIGNTPPPSPATVQTLEGDG